MRVVDELYSLGMIGPDHFELLAQFYFALSVGHCFDLHLNMEQRTEKQILALQTGCRCYFTTLHTRRDGLTRLQTLTLHSYALILLRQRSESLRISAMANTKALECGLHHDGRQFTGNPLETEMRRRVFWCVFMLRTYTCWKVKAVQNELSWFRKICSILQHVACHGHCTKPISRLQNPAMSTTTNLPRPKSSTPCLDAPKYTDSSPSADLCGFCHGLLMSSTCTTNESKHLRGSSRW